MQLLNLALLAIGASAMAIEQRTPQWLVERFSSQHIPHSSAAVTEFRIKGPGFTTHCKHTAPTTSVGGLKGFTGVKCNDTSVSFGTYPVSGAGAEWLFSVHHNTTTHTIGCARASYEQPPHSGMSWDLLALPESFTLTPPKGVSN